MVVRQFDGIRTYVHVFTYHHFQKEIQCHCMSLSIATTNSLFRSKGKGMIMNKSQIIHEICYHNTNCTYDSFSSIKVKMRHSYEDKTLMYIFKDNV